MRYAVKILKKDRETAGETASGSRGAKSEGVRKPIDEIRGGIKEILLEKENSGLGMLGVLRRMDAMMGGLGQKRCRKGR